VARRSGEGPATYWYGWTGAVLLVATILGIIATMLPDSVSRKIPVALAWILPILSRPIIVYTLIPLLMHP
jgi:hypothetical protein